MKTEAVYSFALLMSLSICGESVACSGSNMSFTTRRTKAFADYVAEQFKSAPSDDERGIAAIRENGIVTNVVEIYDAKTKTCQATEYEYYTLGDCTPVITPTNNPVSCISAR